MKTITLTLFLILLCLSSLASAKNEDCISGITQYNICEEAKKLATEIATMLPIDMSQNLSFETVVPVKNKIQGHMRLKYTKQFLVEQYAKASIPIENAEIALENSAKQVCASEPTRAFINLGGAIVYVYYFIDGEHFLTTEVSSC